MPEDTIASMVCSTVCSVSGMPEFHEFQPIGGVSRAGAPPSVGGPAHPAATTHATLTDAATDANRLPIL
jgi:hypothetical protein